MCVRALRTTAHTINKCIKCDSPLSLFIYKMINFMNSKFVRIPPINILFSVTVRIRNILHHLEGNPMFFISL